MQALVICQNTATLSTITSERETVALRTHALASIIPNRRELGRTASRIRTRPRHAHMCALGKSRMYQIDYTFRLIHWKPETSCRTPQAISVLLDDLPKRTDNDAICGRTMLRSSVGFRTNLRWCVSPPARIQVAVGQGAQNRCVSRALVTNRAFSFYCYGREHAVSTELI